MKNFTQFISELKKVSLPVFNAKRLGYSGDGHGGWYNKKTGEFVAKTQGDQLKFYNKPQVIGQQDPKQDRRVPNKLVPKSQQASEGYEKELREKYINGEIFKEGEWVKNINTEHAGKIIRRGTNYLICVTEDDVMFKSWIKDAVEWTNVSGVPASQREVGTDELRNYVMKMTHTTTIDNFNIKNFINKYKVKRK
jgi:hypothetical protein